MSNPKGTIDRFEEDYAVVELENGEMKNILKLQIQGKPEEGDKIYRGVDGLWHIDEELTKSEKERIRIMMDGLFEK